MSQSDLARVANVPVGTLRNWEQDRRIPRLDTAAHVARALGVTLDALAGDFASTQDRSEPESPAEAPKRGRPRKATSEPLPAETTPAVEPASEPGAGKKGRDRKRGER